MKKRALSVLLSAVFLAACGTSSPGPAAPPETPVETPAENPAETPSEAPAETPAETPAEAPTGGPRRPQVPSAFSPRTYELEEAFDGLSFSEPLAVINDGDDDDDVFVVERGGMIYRVDDDDKKPFLDLTGIVDASGQEMGLLGLAFHPDYRDDRGFIYVNYTKDGQTFISRFTAEDDDRQIDLTTEKIILTFDQPQSNHNGGTVLFGPDGYLYISSGDGGGSGDPDDNGQDLTTLLGKILRIDVDTEDEPYLIPNDNPFRGEGNGVREEIYAYGLRNPWKFSFDPGRDLFIAADVGQGEIEEIDIIESGGNYGWNRLEGSEPFTGDEPSDHILPIYEYPHSEGRSITGGFTYYDDEVDGLKGAYIYGDFISGAIWALWIDENGNVTNHDLLDTDLMISSFGEDLDGDIFVVDYNGKIYHLDDKD